MTDDLRPAPAVLQHRHCIDSHDWVQKTWQPAALMETRCCNLNHGVFPYNSGMPQRVHGNVIERYSTGF